MALADNIIKLRRQAGWSQEALAAQIGVSRQSVSKWESGQSSPDITHILSLASLFEVSTDELLGAASANSKLPLGIDPVIERADLESDQDSQRFLIYKAVNAATLTRGVVWCVLAPGALFLSLAISHEWPDMLSRSSATVLGILLLLGVVARGGTYFMSALAEQDRAPQLPKSPFTLDQSLKQSLEQQLATELPVIHYRMSVGITLFVLCSAPLITAAALGMGSGAILLTLILLLGMVALGLHFVIPASARRESLRYLLLGGDLEADKDEDTRRAERIAAVYWPLLLACYLFWSLWTMNWGVTWIIFPVGAVAFGGVLGLSKLLERNSDNSRA